MKIVNPATEQVYEIRETPIDDLPEMVLQAKEAQKKWGEKKPSQRAEIIAPLASLLEKHQNKLAKTITENMGKPLARAIDEIALTTNYVSFFCEKAPHWLNSETIPDGYISYDPIGIVGIISPWNYPYSTAFLALIPSLLAGNGVLFKPSEHAAQTGEDIQWLFSQLEGFPEGLLQVIIGGKEHGKELVKQNINMIAFTGSTVAGKQIMRESADTLKKVILELGGLDAAIVLKDANLEFTAENIILRNTANTGQVCCSIKRVYVEQEVYKEFIAIIAEISKKITTGNPLKNFDMGPLVADFQREKVEEIIEDAKRKGAEVLTGGRRIDGPGYFFPSTVLTEVSHEMRVMKEEPFGPILPVFSVSSWEEAVKLSNDTPYGLTGSIWTKDEELAKKIAEKLTVGVAAINIHGPGPLGTPWGGAKESGLGRMKSKEGMREFTNIKLVRVHSQPEIL